jgi:AcrR family transcriptional regulator
MESVERPRNPRGSGAKLRQEIVAAAIALMDATPDPAELTLRSVARQVGVTAPAIYPHFPDVSSIYDAVVNASYGNLAATFVSSTAKAPTASEILYRGCASYLEFGRKHPARYALMSRRPATGGVRPQAFPLLVAALQGAIDAGDSASTDAARDAATLWAGVHGLSTIVGRDQPTPWGDDFTIDEILHNLVRSVARLRD